MTDYPKRNYLEGDFTINRCGKDLKPEGAEWDKLLQEIERADDQVLKRQTALSIAEETGGAKGWPDRSRQKAERLIAEKRRYLEYLDKQRAEAVAAIVDAEQELNTPKPVSSAKAAVIAEKTRHLQRAQAHLDDLLEQKYQHIRRTWRKYYSDGLEAMLQQHQEFYPLVMKADGNDRLTYIEVAKSVIRAENFIPENQRILDEDYLYDCKRLGQEPNPYVVARYEAILDNPRWLPPGYTPWLEEGEYFDEEEERIYRYDGKPTHYELPPEPQEPRWPPCSTTKEEPLTENTAPQDLDLFTRLAEGDID